MVANEQALEEVESSALLRQLYASRGVHDTKGLSSKLADLLPPDTLTNNQAMARSLADAIEAKKRILVVGDYDADGATASAVAVKGLRLFGATVDFIVPNRFEYGYGLTPEIVRLAQKQGPDVLLTVDNGIASVDGVATANALGMEVLVTDHHLPGEALPEARCIVNPNQFGCDFPSKNLAGVGVMFYVLMALRAEVRERGHFNESNPEPNLSCLLDLVALGTVADLVKLDANNRILVEQGLRRIRAGVCAPGVLALLNVSGRDYQFANAQDMGFYVGPRLNAAGRLEDMTVGIQCLLAENLNEAMELAGKLHQLNQQRREIEAQMQDDASISLSDIKVENQFTLSLFEPDWHQGVIGILASRVKERFHRPVIVFADAGDGTLKGSGRSIKGLHLRDALDAVTKLQPDLIIKFGGHAMAAGLSIRQNGLAEFAKTFETVVRQMISSSDLESVIEVDGAMPEEAMSLAVAAKIESQVWGQGFPEPLFLDEFNVLQKKVVGEKHLKLILQKASQVIDAIYFNETELNSETIQAVYQLQTNRFREQENLQLMIRHVC